MLFSVNLASLTCGVSFGWTSPVLPKLQSNETTPFDEPVTVGQASWIGSLLPVGAVLGPFLAGSAADKIGRKWTLLVSVAPFVPAFITSAFSSSLVAIYIARFVCGLGTGGVFTVLPMYVGEISDDSLRGSLSSMLQLFVTFGLLFSYACGPYLNLATFNLVCAVVPVSFLVLMFVFVPESPYYLIAAGKEDEAEDALGKFRGRNKNEVSSELADIKKSVQSSASERNISDVLKSRGCRKAFVLSIGLVFFQQFSGINVVLFYAETVFEATGSGIPSDISTIIVGVVQVTFSVVTPMLVERQGKRLLLLWSAVGMAAPHFVLGYYFYQKENGNAIETLFWLPVLCLIFYNATYCIGFGPLPWAVLGELFPQNVKSVASTLTASVCWFLAFLITKYFSVVASLIGNGASFCIFGSMCLLAGSFVYRFLPETSGKSLKEIQDILEKGSK